MKRMLSLYSLFAALLVSLAAPSMLAQGGYSQTNLVSNVSGAATTTDTNLSNPWGISFAPGQDFWIANNNTGTSTLYDAKGNKNSLVVTIPGAASNPNGNCSPGCPTGTIANGNETYFGGAAFVFDTEDGLIISWSSGTTATVAFDNSKSGAVYKGLATLGTSLLAANFNTGKVDVYDSNFNPTSLTGSFTNPNLPAGLAPHGIHVIGNQVYVAYAMQDNPKHDAVPGAGAGQVDIFDTSGNFVSTFVAADAQNHLNAPWGVVQTPAGFGTFANDILVANFGDGTISAFDPTGKYLGQLTNSSGATLVNPGIWDMVFGAGGTGDPGTLYFTAGGSAGQPNFPPGGSATSVFAGLVPASSAAAGFSLNLSAPSATVAPGASTSLTVSAAAVGGFNNQITLSCSSVSGLTCTFSPSTISPGASASSTLTIAATSTPPPMGYRASAMGMGILFPGAGVLGMMIGVRHRKRGTKSRRRALWMSILGMLVVSALFTVGCSGSGKSSNPSSAASSSSQVTLMVTGTSGSITQTAPVTVTIQ